MKTPVLAARSKYFHMNKIFSVKHFYFIFHRDVIVAWFAFKLHYGNT